MSTTRRSILGGAMASPLLAAFGGTASGAEAQHKWGSVSDAWAELRWSPQVQETLDRLEVGLEAVGPATLGKDKRTVRFPVRSATGDPALKRLPQAQGNGGFDGGLLVRTPHGKFRITDLEGDLRNEQVFGKGRVNGIEMAMQPMLRYNLEEGRLIADPVRAGQTQKIRIEKVPVRPTDQSLKAFTDTFGDDTAFTTDTVLAHLTAEGFYLPPAR